MAASWLRQYSDYSNGAWDYWIIPQGVGGNVAPNRIQFITTQTGYIAPAGEQYYRMVIPENNFDSDVSADAAGIISTLMIMNWLSWQVADMGGGYTHVCKHLIARQDALKSYLSIIHHPESHFNLCEQLIDCNLNIKTSLIEVFIVVSAEPGPLCYSP